ncbi:MAG: ATP-binding cassette protein [Ferruginibacter sp.]|nr:ATP-binding cassette protein [Ferruginibacter sp.]
MQISLTNTGKRYNRDWIFRHLDFTFEPAAKYAITGSNGSGKSTLLQVIAGALLHTEGKVEFSETINGTSKSIEQPYSRLSFAGPYLDLIEEMTATEFLNFHSSFKPFTTTVPAMLEEVALGNAAQKQIRYFSSGMKQRLKLAQGFFCQSPVLLLDEPTTNLDADGVALYQQLIKKYTENKLVIVSSNDPEEYRFCQKLISIADYK